MFPGTFFGKTFFSGAYFPSRSASAGIPVGRAKSLRAIQNVFISLIANKGIENDVVAIRNVSVRLRVP
jgi:hypothetical protein